MTDQKEKTLDAMLDLETLGTRPGCVVLSAAALLFDADTGETQDYVHTHFNIHEQILKFGLHVQQDTQAWWLQQSNEAQTRAIEPGSHSKVWGPQLLKHGLTDLASVLGQANSRVWAQGASFDFPILSHLYRIAGIDAPWQFWAERDTRTLYEAASMFGFDRKVMDASREGVHHDALSDCEHQVLCVTAAKRTLRGESDVAKAT